MTIGSEKTVSNATCWKKRTNLERKLVFILVFAVLVSIFLIVITAKLSAKKSNVCFTPACIEASSEILRYMDQTVNPCDDFYEFSCGKFLKETIIPDDKVSTSPMQEMDDLLQEQIRRAVEEPVSSKDLKPFVLVKMLYKACMNRTLIERQGLERARAIISHLGGWPVLEGTAWNERDFDWKQVMYNLRHLGLSDNFLFDLGIGIDYKNNTRRTLTLDQARLGLLRKLLIKGFEEKLVKAYYEYMVDIAVIFGADRTLAQKELKASLDFEIKLANISIAMEDRRNQSLEYNPITVEDLQQTYSSVPWLKFINMYLAPVETIHSNEIINVYVPKFFRDFEELIRRTPKRILANYLLWRSVQDMSDYLNEEIRKREFKFISQLTGKTEPRPRWKFCVDASDLTIATGALYVRKYFDHETKHKVEQLVEYVQAAFRDMLKKDAWIDVETRKRAFEKADSMTKHIGFPDELLDDKKIEDYYQDLVVQSDQFLMSILNVSLFEVNKIIRRLREPVNKTDWRSHTYPQVVNAFYSFDENSIQFPAGILQGIFFNKDHPFYLNFGAIGYVIGHEITHGFDDEGRQFDKNGNLKDWWEPATHNAYMQKAQCIIDQYSNYTAPEVGMNLNGINTQGENIADNGGVREAYLAYEKWVLKHGREQLLPGLNYSQEQLFWISSAMSWCQKIRPESLKISVLSDPHAPARYRIIVPFSNNEYFAKDFKCSLGSKMNPKHKCTVW